MYEIFADFHIHIGRSENNKPIKITAAKNLQFANIAKECAERKGIQVARHNRLRISLCPRGYR